VCTGEARSKRDPFLAYRRNEGTERDREEKRDVRDEVMQGAEGPCVAQILDKSTPNNPEQKGAAHTCLIPQRTAHTQGTASAASLLYDTAAWHVIIGHMPCGNRERDCPWNRSRDEIDFVLLRYCPCTVFARPPAPWSRASLPFLETLTPCRQRMNFFIGHEQLGSDFRLAIFQALIGRQRIFRSHACSRPLIRDSRLILELQC
jgi:hypothetical protein